MGAFYIITENRRDILNTTLLIRITVLKQSLIMGGQNLNILFNYLEFGNDANE